MNESSQTQFEMGTQQENPIQQLTTSEKGKGILEEIKNQEPGSSSIMLASLEPPSEATVSHISTTPIAANNY